MKVTAKNNFGGRRKNEAEEHQTKKHVIIYNGIPGQHFNCTLKNISENVIEHFNYRSYGYHEEGMLYRREQSQYDVCIYNIIVY